MKTLVREQPLTAATNLLFWSWNAIFLSTTLLGFAPLVWWHMIQDALAGELPSNFLIFATAAQFLPVVCSIAGLFLVKDAGRLFRLFYAVEAPAFLLCMGRVFFVQELSKGSAFVLGVLALGVAGQAYALFRPMPSSRPALGAAELALASVGLATSVYLVSVVSFFALPAAVGLLHLLVRAPGIIIAMLPFLLMVYTATLFVALPPALAFVAGKGWIDAFTRFSSYSVLHRALAPLVAVVTVSSIGAGFVWSDQQSQGRALQMVESPIDPPRRANILAEEAAVQDGLLNAYLARFRYAGARDGSRGEVQRMYERELGFPEWLSGPIQGAYDGLISPFLYDGNWYEDQLRAKEAYGQLFDQPIERAQLAAIKHAHSSSFDRGSREAGLLDVGEERVWLAEQNIEIHERGDFAEIEIHEAYENRTHQQEEILYYFSLPESAVITGLWLSETDDKSHAFEFAIAPRGAAQAVYKAEVQRRVDPALLEQVGPRQYRLRAFPIPPKQYDHFNVDMETQARMHLWMRFAVLREGSSWPMPKLAERRNVFWNEDTARTLAGADNARLQNWLPASVPVSKDESPRRHDVILPGGLVVRAEPSAGAWTGPSPTGRHFAVVIDRSYSMRRHVDEVKQTLESIEAEISPDNRLDYYYASGPWHGSPASRSDHIENDRLDYFGAHTLSGILQEMAALRDGEVYDAIFVLTDEGTYEHESDEKIEHALGAPLWMVHFGGFPAAYEDGTLDAIQRSGGGVTHSFSDALEQWTERSQRGAEILGRSGGFVWSLVRDDGAVHDEHFAPLAARQFILAAVESQKQSASVESLDRLHAVAKRFGIVTPYSSMLVLVNDRQKQALAEAEAKDDRFDREVERGTESGPNITGTPEPEEWLLIGLAGLALLYMLRHRRDGIPGQMA